MKNNENINTPKFGSKEHKKLVEDIFGEMTDKEYKELWNSLKSLVKKELYFSETIAKITADQLGIDYEKYGNILLVGARYSLDKLYRIKLKKRRDTLYQENYNDKETVEIIRLTFKEYLLAHGLLPENEIYKVLDGMLKYEKAFENELKFYSIIKDEGIIQGFEMEEHDIMDVLRLHE